MKCAACAVELSEHARACVQCGTAVLRAVEHTSDDAVAVLPEPVQLEIPAAPNAVPPSRSGSADRRFEQAARAEREVADSNAQRESLTPAGAIPLTVTSVAAAGITLPAKNENRSRLWILSALLIVGAGAGAAALWMSQPVRPLSRTEAPSFNVEKKTNPTAPLQRPTAVDDVRAPVAVAPLRSDQALIPKVRVGDRWVTEVFDHQDAKLNYRSERIVTQVRGSQITTTARNLKSNYTRTVDYDEHWSLLSSRQPTGATTQYSPAIPYLKFPAQPGDSWGTESVETAPSGDTKVHVIRARVESWETITVPAGTFRALKVVLNDEVREKGLVVLQGEDTSWYVPGVRRTVKTEEASYQPATGERRRRTLVLTEYSLQ